MSNIKIAVGGLEHETAGFLDGNTKLDEFLESKISKNEIIQRVGTSNTVVDGYISGIKKYGWEPNFTISYLQSKRDVIDPNPGFRNQLQNYYEKLYKPKDFETLV